MALAIDFLGNISLRLVGLLVTVGTLAAVYFFVIKPIGDTTENAFDSFAPVFEQVDQAQELAEEVAAQGDKSEAKQFQVCLKKAGQKSAAIERCVNQYAP